MFYLSNYIIFKNHKDNLFMNRIYIKKYFLFIFTYFFFHNMINKLRKKKKVLYTFINNELKN